jgi:hypothetical protein
MPEHRIDIVRYAFGSQIVSAGASWTGFPREQRLVAIVLEGQCELVAIADSQLPIAEMSSSQSARAMHKRGNQRSHRRCGNPGLHACYH